MPTKKVETGDMMLDLLDYIMLELKSLVRDETNFPFWDLVVAAPRRVEPEGQSYSWHFAHCPRKQDKSRTLTFLSELASFRHILQASSYSRFLGTVP